MLKKVRNTIIITKLIFQYFMYFTIFDIFLLLLQYQNKQYLEIIKFVISEYNLNSFIL